MMSLPSIKQNYVIDALLPLEDIASDEINLIPSKLDVESPLTKENLLSRRAHATFAYLEEIQKNPISSKDILIAHNTSINTQIQGLRVFEKSIQANCSLPFHSLEEELKAPPASNNLPDVPLFIHRLSFTNPSYLTHSIQFNSRSNIEQHMAIADGIVSLYKFFPHLINKTGIMIKETYNADCKRNENSQKLCKKIENLCDFAHEEIAEYKHHAKAIGREAINYLVTENPSISFFFKSFTQVTNAISLDVRKALKVNEIQEIMKHLFQNPHFYNQPQALPNELKKQFDFPVSQSIKFCSDSQQTLLFISSSLLKDRLFKGLINKLTCLFSQSKAKEFIKVLPENSNKNQIPLQFTPNSQATPFTSVKESDLLISKRRKLQFSDIGSQPSLKTRRPSGQYNAATTHLEGWITPKKGYLKVQLDWIKSDDGSLNLFFKGIPQLKKIALANNLEYIELKGWFSNDKFLEILKKKYPTFRTEISQGQSKEILYHIFKIPID